PRPATSEHAQTSGSYPAPFPVCSTNDGPCPEVETLPGKVHHWYCKPGMVRDTNLMFVRAHLLPAEAHKFHYHPRMEEILYVLAGAAEQWVEREKRVLRPG